MKEKIIKIFSLCFIIFLVAISMINIGILYFEVSKIDCFGFYHNYNLGFEKIKTFIPFIFIEIILLIKIIVDKIKQKNNQILYGVLFVLTLIVVIISGNLLKKEINKKTIVIDTLPSALSTFNSQFTTYEGNNISASNIRQLIKLVNENNAQNEGTDLVISVNNRKDISEYVVMVDSDKKYKVECEKLNGAVNNINIYYENNLIEIDGI